ncbi:MAG TPA: phosphate acyltransferase, partial [Gemmatimonadaceae bacterium]
MSFLSAIRARASSLGARVAFGEAGDERVLEAATRLKREGVATPVLVGPEAGSAEARKRGLECVDPANDPRRPELAAALLKARAKHGMTQAEADNLAQDPLAFSIWLVKTGAVDAAVGGAVRTTRELMHFALWLIGPAPGVKTVSSAFYMVMPSPDDRVLTFTDCSVVPNPTADQLADIAIAAASARRKIVGDDPRVALLSYSTKGSGGDGASIAN